MGAAFIEYRKIVFPVAERCMPFYQLGLQSYLFEQLLIGYTRKIIDKISSNEKNVIRKLLFNFKLRHVRSFFYFFGSNENLT